MSKIIKLQTENVKRIQAIEIHPDGSVVIIGGDNEAGKSSVLDSIEYAFGGKAAQCEMPLRRGTDKGYTVVETEDLVVKRTFSPTGTSLRVFSRDGAEYKSPQKILDAMVGSLAFDPLAFMAMKEAQQASTLRELFGIDVSDLDAKRKQIYDERTDVNRHVGELTARLKTMELHADAPGEEVPTSTVLEELDAARKVNHDNANKRQEIIAIDSIMVDRNDQIDEINKQLEVLAKRLEGIIKEIEDLTTQKAELTAAVAGLTDIDEAPIRSRLESLDGDNAKVRQNQVRKATEESLNSSRLKAEELSRAILKIDQEKASRFEQAEIPVPGLSFDEGRVLYDGIPLEQCSQAMRLRISVAMGMAQHSDLRVMLIREGSLLDSKSLALLKELAEKNDTQIWLEVVGDRADCSVVIEDGRVKEKTGE